jgi:hypothetical protein
MRLGLSILQIHPVSVQLQATPRGQAGRAPYALPRPLRETVFVSYRVQTSKLARPAPLDLASLRRAGPDGARIDLATRSMLRPAEEPRSLANALARQAVRRRRKGGFRERCAVYTDINKGTFRNEFLVAAPLERRPTTTPVGRRSSGAMSLYLCPSIYSIDSRRKWLKSAGLVHLVKVSQGKTLPGCALR